MSDLTSDLIRIPMLCSPVEVVDEDAALPRDLQIIDFAARPCTICGSHQVAGLANHRTEYRCAEHLHN